MSKTKLKVVPAIASSSTKPVKATPAIEMPAGVNHDPPLTLEQAAVYLNVSVRTMHRYKDANKIAFYKYDGGLRFRVSALERFMAKRLVRAA
jgi:excisionase family DNA binding protein